MTCEICGKVIEARLGVALGLNYALISHLMQEHMEKDAGGWDLCWCGKILTWATEAETHLFTPGTPDYYTHWLEHQLCR